MAAARKSGEAACRKQRGLRTRLFTIADVREHDLTSDFDRKAKPESLPVDAEIVGTVVCRFSLRLPNNVHEHNYMQNDNGQRHLFEVT